MSAMSVWEWLLLLCIAGLCGGLGQAIAGYSRGGCLAAIAIGFVGALLGVWMQRETGLPELFTVDFNNTDGVAVHFPIIWSIIGAVIFVAIVGFFTRRAPDDRYV